MLCDNLEGWEGVEGSSGRRGRRYIFGYFDIWQKATQYRFRPRGGRQNVLGDEGGKQPKGEVC